MPPGTPRSRSQRTVFAAPQPRVCRGAWLFLRGSSVPRPSSKKKRVYGRNMVPPVRSRAARCAVPPGVSAETPAIEKGSWQGRKALTEGLWVAYRSGLTVTGCFLLHLSYNPSGSHPFATSPYTGEARGGGRWLTSHHFTGRQGAVGGGLALPSSRSPALPFYSIRATALHKISADKCAAFCSNWS